MSLSGPLEIITLILIVALLMLLVTKSQPFAGFVSFASQTFNRSLAALGGQKVG